jgi:hypothetical protein
LTQAWYDALKAHVEKKPAVILRIAENDWESLQESRRGVGEFTTAFPHAAFAKLQAPTVCLLLAESEGEPHAYLGLIGARSAITTLQSRVKIKRAVAIEPASTDALVALLDNSAHQRAFEERLRLDQPLTVLSPKLSGHLIERLASVSANVGPMRTLAASLAVPRRFRSNDALQEDAIRMALKAFGLGPDDRASALDLTPRRATALARVPIIEDGAIEHDARKVPGFDLIGSDLTGRALFSRGRERLEIFTANRRQLERAFGVDLIYFNVTRRNLAMLQYKMLEPPKGNATDWTFTPDDQLDKELVRMRKFAKVNEPGPHEYRLNPAAFFLKFVKRDGALRQSGLIMPIDHYDGFVQSPAARGPRGSLRISYESLGGSYLREQPFLDLIRAGYIGSYADSTKQLMTLVKGVLGRGRAVVAAIQTSVAEIAPASVGDDDEFEF